MKLFFALLPFFFLTKASLAAEKLKVVTLAPHLTEIVYALNKEDLLVGNTAACDYPEAAKKVPKVGDYISPSLELILQSKANLVFATEGNSRETLEKIKRLGKKVIEVDPKTAEDLPKSIEQVAKELGAEPEGKKLSQKISASLKNLTSHKRPPSKALIALQFAPVYSVNEKTWVGDIFRIAGFKNIAEGTKIKYPVLSAEHIFR